jgi:aryl-alcohol dehydrogenase-like predicted oxidoreductase
MKPEVLSSYFQPILPYLQRFHAEAIRHNTNPLTLALAYINSLEMVDHVLIGVTKNIELQEILKVANRTFQIDYDQFSVTNERILNPSNWQF